MVYSSVEKKQLTLITNFSTEKSNKTVSELTEIRTETKLKLKLKLKRTNKRESLCRQTKAEHFSCFFEV